MRWWRRCWPTCPKGAIEPPAGHMRFPGTISVPDAAFEATLEYAARSFRRHGFRDIVLIGDHGGYQKSLERVAAAAEPRMGRRRRRACTRSRTTTGPPMPSSRRCCAQGPRRRRDRHPCRPRRHVADAGGRPAPGARRAAARRTQRPGRPMACTAIRAAASAALGQAGVDLIVERTGDAIAGATARPLIDAGRPCRSRTLLVAAPISRSDCSRSFT